MSSRVLIVGLGGLGSPAALYLAAAGIGTLGFVDSDVVEKSNLHRQIVHSEESVREEMGKVQSAVLGCKRLNSEIEYIGYNERLSWKNALGIIEKYDVVLDCTDNPATRYLISDACVVSGKTLVSGAAQKVEGQMVVLNYPSKNTDGESGRDRVIGVFFPRPPDPEMVRGCNEIGILGPVVGCIGTMIASEAIRLIVSGVASGQVKEERRPSMLLYNAWSKDPKGMFRTVMLAGKRKGCVACGEEEEILRRMGKEKITRDVFERGSVDYEAWCGRVEDVNILGKKNRIGAKEFLETVRDEVVVDVREENEFLLGPKVGGSVNIPISRILRDPESAFGSLEQKQSNGLLDGETDDQSAIGRPMYFVCQRGNDSQIAAQKLMDLDLLAGRQRSWVGDVEGGFVAMERPP